MGGPITGSLSPTFSFFEAFSWELTNNVPLKTVAEVCTDLLDRCGGAEAVPKELPCRDSQVRDSLQPLSPVLAVGLTPPASFMGVEVFAP